MKRLLLALALAGMTSYAYAQQCVSTDAVIEKATEFKRPYAYLGRGETLTMLAAIYSAQTGHSLDPDRAMVIDIEGNIVVGILIIDQICGFLMIHDDDFAKIIKTAAFGIPA